MNAKDHMFTVYLPAHVARRVGTVAAVLGVAAAVPAAIFVQPVIMGVAAGAATVGAILRLRASHEQGERRSGVERRGSRKPSEVVRAR